MEKGDIQSIKRLLQKGADINRIYEDGLFFSLIATHSIKHKQSALSLAALDNELFEILLESKQIPRITPTLIARIIDSQNLSMLELLAQKGFLHID